MSMGLFGRRRPRKAVPSRRREGWQQELIDRGWGAASDHEVSTFLSQTFRAAEKWCRSLIAFRERLRKLPNSLSQDRTLLQLADYLIENTAVNPHDLTTAWAIVIRETVLNYRGWDGRLSRWVFHPRHRIWQADLRRRASAFGLESQWAEMLVEDVCKEEAARAD